MGVLAGASARERVRMSRASPPRPWRRMTAAVAWLRGVPAGRVRRSRGGPARMARVGIRLGRGFVEGEGGEALL